MHLIYKWFDQCDRVRGRGIKFTSKYDIEIVGRTEEGGIPVVEVSIRDNQDYVENFFGERVYDIAAAVGKNGFGKTTLTHMIMDYAPEQITSLNPLKKGTAFFSIYEDTGHVPRIRIVAHRVKIVCGQDVVVSGSSARVYYQPIVYLSNVFNPAELRDSFTTGDIGINSRQQQRSYTPALIMKRYLDKKRKAYHHYYDIGYNIALYTLADLQMQDMVRAYEDYQAVSFVNCYFHAPSSIRNELAVFDQITIRFRAFAEELHFEPEEKKDYERWKGSIGRRSEDSPAEPVQMKSVSPRFVLEFCKCYVDQNVKSKKSDWKSNVLTCLFSEVVVLLFGALLGKVCTSMAEFIYALDVTTIDIWDTLKGFLENEQRSEDCCVDERNMKYAAGVFNQYYHEAKEIIGWDEPGVTTEGLYPIQSIEGFLKRYEEAYLENRMWAKYISLELHPASSGELAMTNLMSYVYQAFTDPRGNNEDVMLIIDELDAYMHPEWQQEILNWLLKWWSEDELFGKGKLQLFFTTHSPILLSDIPGDKVTHLRREGQEIILEPAGNKTFGADIYTLFYDSFFMKKGSIGEFAKYKVNMLIDWLKGKDADVDEKEALYLLESIGDHNAAAQLRGMYEEKKYRTADAGAFRSKLENLSPEEQEVLMEYIRRTERRND